MVHIWGHETKSVRVRLSHPVSVLEPPPKVKADAFTTGWFSYTASYANDHQQQQHDRVRTRQKIKRDSFLSAVMIMSLLLWLSTAFAAKDMECGWNGALVGGVCSCDTGWQGD